jgi:hypothetical protein
MKKTITGTIVFAVLGCFSLLATATAAQDWEQALTKALDAGKIEMARYESTTAKDGGLAYTRTEEKILTDAFTAAFKAKAPACGVMKLSIEKRYTPFMVIKTIYSVGENLNIDEVCTCATEAGVLKAVTLQAAREAKDSNEKPKFKPDEIAQSQCLGQGLAYTEQGQPGDVIPIPNPNPPVSPSVPK